MTRFPSQAGKVIALATCLIGAALLPARACDHWNPPPKTDTPDESFTDTNGDGIDGMRCGPIFVAGNGNDKNPGTIDRPMRNLNAAILAAAAMTPVRDVYVSSNSTYYGSVMFLPGVNVYGGYDHTNGWSRSSAKAVVQGRSIGAWIPPGGSGLLTIDSLDIRASDIAEAGQHSIGLVADANMLVGFRNCTIRSGFGGSGNFGDNGVAGARGGAGQAGEQGECDSIMPNRGPIGGSGGAGATQGGGGGRGGSDGTSYPAQNGFPGHNGGGSGGGAGGDYGAGGDPGRDGKNGQNGNAGQNGAHGAGGTIWYADGLPGSDGANGYGGGGGGGGGGQDCTWCIRGAGNAGGGGGGGGYLGTAGTAGTAGGSSIGLLVREGLIGLPAGTSIFAGRGGNGGNGGKGGKGGAGGAGGSGGSTCVDEVGRGGNGGNGGKGGDGGHGGGGAGGHSIAVLEEGGAVPAPLSTWIAGLAGLGGTTGPGGNPGLDGVSAAHVRRPSSQPKITLPSINAPIALHGRLIVPMDSPAVLVTPILADPDNPTSYSLTVPSQPEHGGAAAAGDKILYKPHEGYWGYDAIPIRYTDNAHNPPYPVNGYVVVYVTPPPLDRWDAASALRTGAGLRARTPEDARLDVDGDGAITMKDALQILRDAN